MDIKCELQRIAEYQNSLLSKHDRLSKETIDKIVANAVDVYEKKNYNFGSYNSIQLDQNGKKRNVKMYPPFSPEELLCIYLKRLLDRKFHISYPNRNVFVRELFNTVYALKDMSDYTIFRFDFSDFFNSVSSTYVFEKFISPNNLERYQLELVGNYVSSTRYAYAGLNTSNIICEIVAQYFDDILLKKMIGRGAILFKRYIDDGIIIFNRYLSSSECTSIVNEAVKEAFQDPAIKVSPLCKTKLNSAKTKYVSKRQLHSTGVSQSFDFLGYEFILNEKSDGKTNFQFGITQNKIDKYSKRIDALVKEYIELGNSNMEILRHQIKAFTHRTVYQVNRYKSTIWKSKGFVSNYSELRYHMDELTPDTKKFLKNAVFNAFKKNGASLPYFLRGNNNESIYSLYNNLKTYKTQLFVEPIGINKKTLQKMCVQIGVPNVFEKDYSGLVRDYLINVKVGH